ncbi:MAG: hypothetical protein KatS3mg002_1466 [Candidatus Woesearchaeota archaeon]|nr:MAG: hypothetical protein KatS3mg002_1466 [Candidatus Woesearchaeota archaeon]
MDCHNISWVYIDFLKNPYVDSNNMLKTKCIEFLLLQILALQPTIILTLGNKDGLKDFFNIFAYPKKLNGGVTWLHGKYTNIKIDIPFLFKNQYFQFPEDKRNDYKNTYSCILDFPYECNWIVSMFPGGMNFNFTSISGWESIFESIGKILNKPINPENCPEC